ncbi:MAG: IS66 family insertion sequence element accessory protein TnpB [Gammaproteobacteria bacterium]|nr:IS66 family insertion sequence element accessory protein TnpB [Gammaproteobacteria bacterium]
MKCFYWERNDFYLLHKKLEQERFKWPMDRDSAATALSGQQLNWLLDVGRLQSLGWSARTGLRKGIEQIYR